MNDEKATIISRKINDCVKELEGVMARKIVEIFGKKTFDPSSDNLDDETFASTLATLKTILFTFTLKTFHAIANDHPENKHFLNVIDIYAETLKEHAITFFEVIDKEDK